MLLFAVSTPYVEPAVFFGDGVPTLRTDRLKACAKSPKGYEPRSA